jgi:hypothetical protein
MAGREAWREVAPEIPYLHLAVVAASGMIVREDLQQESRFPEVVITPDPVTSQENELFKVFA